MSKKSKTDWNKVDAQIKHAGTEITLPAMPEPMPTKVAIATLQRRLEDEERMMDVFETIDAYPYEALVAFTKAMKLKYGWASPVPTPGFFGPEPPKMLMVKTGPSETDTIQVPYGSFVLPNVENPVQTIFHHNDRGQPCLVIKGQIRKKHVHILKSLCDLARQIARDESIYRGKAIRLPQDESGEVNLSAAPDFIPTSHVKPEELILNDETAWLVNVNLFTPILRTEACRAAGIPLKRGVLLEGPYGTGKSMISAITSRLCVENGWTFVLINSSLGLAPALEFGMRYGPAVVFAEDIDRVLDERDEGANTILNILDGVLSKGSEIMVVLTSNFAEKIDRAMLRPGRLDAVINIPPPDASAAQRLIRLYGRDMLAKDADLGQVGLELAGQIPATIREVTERSKLAMIHREGENALSLIQSGKAEVAGDDLVVTARGMVRHLALLNSDKAEVAETPAQKFALALTGLVADAANPVTKDEGGDTRQTVRRASSRLSDHITDVSGQVDTFEKKTAKKLNEVDADVKAVKRKLGA